MVIGSNLFVFASLFKVKYSALVGILWFHSSIQKSLGISNHSLFPWEQVARTHLVSKSSMTPYLLEHFPLLSVILTIYSTYIKLATAKAEVAQLVRAIVL